MAIPLSAVLEDPHRAARILEDEVPGSRVVRIVRADQGVILDVEFDALPELPDYPLERARVRILATGEVEAIPLGAKRAWKHRNASPLGPGFGTTAGTLCLFYPNDPDPLTWTWTDGLADYLVRLRRHLIYEEAWRRTGAWPIEDAPHGEPARGTHPIVTSFMKQEVRRWRRSPS